MPDFFDEVSHTPVNSHPQDIIHYVRFERGSKSEIRTSTGNRLGIATGQGRREEIRVFRLRLAGHVL